MMTERVPNALLREAFLRSGRTPRDLAKDLDWPNGRSYDASRVKRTLGLAEDISGSNGRHSTRRTVNVQLAVRMAEALGLDPWEIGA